MVMMVMELKWVWFIRIALTVMSVLVLGDACLEHERIALLQLKPFFNHYKFLSDWDEAVKGSDCCRWRRVECNTTTRRVIGLSLNYTRRYNMGDQYLNASLFLPFKGLKTLDLSGNYIAGFVENEGLGKLSSTLSHLESLDLSDNLFRNNTFSFPKGLSSLKSLNMNTNNLQGSLDLKELSNLINLKKLDLSQNQIESLESIKGTATKLKLLSHLEVLDLDYNYFNISVFASLKGLSNLKSLSIRSNMMNGSFRMKDLDVFVNLRKLQLSGNELKDFVINKELNVSTRLEEIFLDGSILNTNFLQNIGVFTSVITYF